LKKVIRICPAVCLCQCTPLSSDMASD